MLSNSDYKEWVSHPATKFYRDTLLERRKDVLERLLHAESTSEVVSIRAYINVLDDFIKFLGGEFEF